MQQTVQCPRCGAQNYQGQPVCWNCGLQLINYPQQPPQQQPPTQQMPPYQQQQYQQQQYPQQQYPQQQYQQQQYPQQQYQQQQYGYGWQQPRKQGPSMLLILLAVCVVLLIGAGAYLMFSGNGFNLPFGSSDNQASTSPEDEQPADSEPEEEQVKTELTIVELVDEYMADPDAAASKYKGKIVTITGILYEASVQDGTVLITDGETPTMGAQCMLLSNEIDKIYDLEPEQTIKVKGTIDDYDIYINVIDCTIVS